MAVFKQGQAVFKGYGSVRAGSWCSSREDQVESSFKTVNEWCLGKGGLRNSWDMK